MSQRGNQFYPSIHGLHAGFDQSHAKTRKRFRSDGGLAGGDRYSHRRFGDTKTVEMWDDFVGDVLADEWTIVEGTDSGTTDAALVATGIGGELLFTTGDAGTGLAADLVQMTSHRQWAAANGGLCIEARFKLSAITTCYAFFGFTDVATLEAPIISAASGDTITTTATDAVGFMFDTRMSTDNWWLVGVANDVDATKQDTGVAPVADTYAVFRIELDTAGAATFFYNYAPIGTKMTGAVTAATALTPTFAVSKTSVAASMTATMDYIGISMNR